MEDVIVGDKVWDFVYGWGQVIEINPLDNYPLIVKFEDSSVTYTYSGSEFKGYRQTLFWDEVKFEIPERPKPKFKIGDWAVDKHCTKSLLVTDQNIKNINAGTSHTLWQPQEGKLCVFYNTNKYYVIANFDKSINNKHYAKGEWYYNNVAPLEFIKTLKDK